MRSSLGCAFLLLAVAACEDGPTRQARSLPTADAAREALGVRAEETGRVFRGDAYFGRVPESNAVFVAFDAGGDGEEPDRVIDQVFLLQSETALSDALPTDAAGVQLVYTRSSVALHGAGAPPLRFTVAGHPSAPVAGSRVRDWVGYGLSRRTGQWPLVEGVPIARSLESALAGCAGSGSGDAQIQAICDSGGEGSTGCSTQCVAGGGCSVSCGAGFNSCCDRVACTCNCVKAAAPPP